MIAIRSGEPIRSGEKMTKSVTIAWTDGHISGAMDNQRTAMHYVNRTMVAGGSLMAPTSPRFVTGIHQSVWSTLSGLAIVGQPIYDTWDRNKLVAVMLSVTDNGLVDEIAKPSDPRFPLLSPNRGGSFPQL